MQQQEPKGWTPIQDAKRAAYVLAFASRVMACPIEVILRRQFGSRYFGMATLVALFAVPMWTLFWPEADPRGITALWLVFLVMQLRARIESAFRVARGETIHTRYNGWPRLASLFKHLPEKKLKAVIEPALVLVVGVFFMQGNPPLGSYLIVAGICHALNTALIESVERSRALQMNDALIEQQQLGERFRKMRDDGRQS